MNYLQSLKELDIKRVAAIVGIALIVLLLSMVDAAMEASGSHNHGHDANSAHMHM